MSDCKCSNDWGFVALIFLIVLFWGEPDIADSLIYKYTGVKNWEVTE